jgi:hypothetical protein
MGINDMSQHLNSERPSSRVASNHDIGWSNPSLQKCLEGSTALAQLLGIRRNRDQGVLHHANSDVMLLAWPATNISIPAPLKMAVRSTHDISAAVEEEDEFGGGGAVTNPHNGASGSLELFNVVFEAANLRGGAGLALRFQL